MLVGALPISLQSVPNTNQPWSEPLSGGLFGGSRQQPSNSSQPELFCGPGDIVDIGIHLARAPMEKSDSIKVKLACKNIPILAAEFMGHSENRRTDIEIIRALRSEMDILGELKINMVKGVKAIATARDEGWVIELSICSRIYSRDVLVVTINVSDELLCLLTKQVDKFNLHGVSQERQQKLWLLELGWGADLKCQIEALFKGLQKSDSEFNKAFSQGAESSFAVLVPKDSRVMLGLNFKDSSNRCSLLFKSKILGKTMEIAVVEISTERLLKLFELGIITGEDRIEFETNEVTYKGINLARFHPKFWVGVIRTINTDGVVVSKDGKVIYRGVTLSTYENVNSWLGIIDIINDIISRPDVVVSQDDKVSYKGVVLSTYDPNSWLGIIDIINGNIISRPDEVVFQDGKVIYSGVTLSEDYVSSWSDITSGLDKLSNYAKTSIPADVNAAAECFCRAFVSEGCGCVEIREGFKIWFRANNGSQISSENVEGFYDGTDNDEAFNRKNLTKMNIVEIEFSGFHWCRDSETET